MVCGGMRELFPRNSATASFYLASSLDDAAASRPASQLRWLKKALEPLQTTLDEKHFARLVAALSLCIGVEALVVLKDVCRLSSAEAEEVKSWAGQVLLRAALAQGESERAERERRRGTAGARVRTNPAYKTARFINIIAHARYLESFRLLSPAATQGFPPSP